MEQLLDTHGKAAPKADVTLMKDVVVFWGLSWNLSSFNRAAREIFIKNLYS